MTTTPTYNTATPRGAIAQQLATAHPTWTVVDRPTGPDHLSGRRRVYVAVYRTTIGKNLAGAALTHSVTVDLYAAETLTEAAEARLDDRLDELLTTIAGMPNVIWTTAERTEFDGFHGWRITLEAHSADVYAQAARAATT